MARKSKDGGWADLIGSLAQIALIGGAAYVTYKAREAYIDRLLTLSPQDALVSMLEAIPEMSEDAWRLFVSGLETRSQGNRYAKALLEFALNVRKVTDFADNLLSMPVHHATIVLEHTMQGMDDALLNLLRCVLTIRSINHLSAQVLLNYINEIYERGNSTENLFQESLRAALADGVVTPHEASELEQLRRKLNIPAEVAHRIFLDVKRRLKQSP